MVEVKAQELGAHLRPLLADCVAQYILERAVEQVRGRVVASRTVAAVFVDFGTGELPDCYRTLLDASRMDNAAGAVHVGVLDHEQATRRSNPASVANLSAAHRVERRRLEDQARRRTCGELGAGRAVSVSSKNTRFGLDLSPGKKLGRRLIGEVTRGGGVLVTLEACRVACALPEHDAPRREKGHGCGSHQLPIFSGGTDADRNGARKARR